MSLSEEQRETLSGDKAHSLFMSSEPFPLHSFLEEYKSSSWDPGYVLAVIGAFQGMCLRCSDGRYGKIRRPFIY